MNTKAFYIHMLKLSKKLFFEYIFGKQIWKYIFRSNTLFTEYNTFPLFAKNLEKPSVVMSFFTYQDFAFWKKKLISDLCLLYPLSIFYIGRIIRLFSSLKELDKESVYIVYYSSRGKIQSKKEEKNNFFRFLNYLRTEHPWIKRIFIDIDSNNLDTMSLYESFYFRFESVIKFGKFKFIRMIKEI